jgi:hypothetical protein
MTTLKTSWKWLVACGAIFVPSTLLAALTVPHTFTAGTPSKAAQVNENFAEVETYVNDLETQLGDLSTELAAVETSITACPADMSKVGAWCIDNTVSDAVNVSTASIACLDAGKFICPVDALVACDWAAPAASDCTTLTDAPGELLWTSNIAISNGVNWQNACVVFNGNNLLAVEGCGSLHPYLCCGPSAAP